MPSKTQKHASSKKVKTITENDINDEYSWDEYGDLKIIIMKENGYINATKVCNDIPTKTGIKKKFTHWQQDADAIDIIKALSKVNKIPIDDILIPITGGNIAEIRGTYVHPDLVPFIISWASPAFAVRMSRIVNQHFINEAINAK